MFKYVISGLSLSLVAFAVFGVVAYANNDGLVEGPSDHSKPKTEIVETIPSSIEDSSDDTVTYEYTDKTGQRVTNELTQDEAAMMDEELETAQSDVAPMLIDAQHVTSEEYQNGDVQSDVEGAGSSDDVNNLSPNATMQNSNQSEKMEKVSGLSDQEMIGQGHTQFTTPQGNFTFDLNEAEAIAGDMMDGYVKGSDGLWYQN